MLGLLAVADAESARVAYSLPWTAVPPGAEVIGYDIDSAERARVIDAIGGKLEASYVFADVAKRMSDSLAEHERRGDYVGITLNPPKSSALAPMRGALPRARP